MAQPVPRGAAEEAPREIPEAPPLLPHRRWRGTLPPPAGDLWVFGYGSLMWLPGFSHAEVRPARIHGFHRAMCVWSWRYRGTRERPGLVLGLDRGGSCWGRAYRVSAPEKEATLDYLYEREMGGGIYTAALRPVCLNDGRGVRALAFTVIRSHPQYAGRLGCEHAAAVVRGAHGRKGPNREYLANTVAHLEDLGVPDPWLRRVLKLVDEEWSE